ncbi:PhzF family phenazine biosynthesis protein [Glutamicibacter sp. NPDC087344]|uniref:PhzF family phenazine biosynthesis protein n=1 Tax=Glutamicibacter sp. NPDC087344 TaxID=3363994 RepID=UPI0037F1A3B1
MRRRFMQVDVFSHDPFKGNPLGVVIDGQGLSTQQMKDYATWSNLSEVTFVLPPSEEVADFRFRIFAGDQEYPFAGHPTLGTARAWLAAGGQPKNSGHVIAQCQAGLIPVRINESVLSFQSPARVRSHALDQAELQPICEILGISAEHVDAAFWADNGPGWVAVLLNSAQAVLELSPDASKHQGQWKIGVLGPLEPQDANRRGGFEVRALKFADGVLLEDPVTGSLNAAAAEWLIENGRATAPFTNHQGTVLGRRGRVDFELVDGTLWTGGATQVLIDGYFNV